MAQRRPLMQSSTQPGQGPQLGGPAMRQPGGPPQRPGGKPGQAPPPLVPPPPAQPGPFQPLPQAPDAQLAQPKQSLYPGANGGMEQGGGVEGLGGPGGLPPQLLALIQSLLGGGR